jgi:hypothetical protein
MQHLLPDRCPTCGQPWAQDAPNKLPRLLLHWLPKLTVWVALIVLCLGMWWMMSLAH